MMLRRSLMWLAVTVHGLQLPFTARQTSRQTVRMLSEFDVAKEAQIREQLEGGKPSTGHAAASGDEAAATQASFEEAQVRSATLATMLTESCAGGEPMPAEAVATLRALISTTAGARGWFVTLLTDPAFEPVFRPPLDEALLEAVEASPDPNIKVCRFGAIPHLAAALPQPNLLLTRSRPTPKQLMTMNVAMSTATELAHLANGHDDLAAASRMTSDRSAVLLTALLDRMPGLREAAEALLAAVQPDSSSTAAAEAEWRKFCKKWGYGAEQREAIRKKLESVL